MSREMCPNHPSQVVYVGLGNLGGHTYDCQYQGHNLKVIATNTSLGTSWSIRDESENSIILKLDYIPEGITPDNIQEKISTLVVFS